MWGRNGLVSSKKLSWRCRKLHGPWRTPSLLSNTSFIFVSVPRNQMMYARIRHDIAEEQDLKTFLSFMTGQKFEKSDSIEELSRASSAYVMHWSPLNLYCVRLRNISIDSDVASRSVHKIWQFGRAIYSIIWMCTFWSPARCVQFLSTAKSASDSQECFKAAKLLPEATFTPMCPKEHIRFGREKGLNYGRVKDWIETRVREINWIWGHELATVGIFGPFTMSCRRGPKNAN
jgi:hypothetical protein